MTARRRPQIIIRRAYPEIFRCRGRIPARGFRPLRLVFFKKHIRCAKNRYQSLSVPPEREPFFLLTKEKSLNYNGIVKNRGAYPRKSEKAGDFMLGGKYIGVVAETIRRAYDEQTVVLNAVSSLIADTVEKRNNVFVFGCSHAGILAEEVFYRTGGLAVLNPIFYPDLMLNVRPVTLTSKTERTPGIGRKIAENARLKEGDLLVLHSVSGRNSVPVDMALKANELGVKTVCITNLAYSSSVTSRHPSGKRLFEVCDFVIDNKGVPGDAGIEMPGLPEKIGPTSTAVGAALINALVIDAVEIMLGRGFVPPVFMSANLDGGDEHNAKMMEEYKNNIFYM